MDDITIQQYKLDDITIQQFKTEFDALEKVYRQELTDVIENYLVKSAMPMSFNESIIFSIALDKIYNDLLSFVIEDPATRGRGKIATESSGFQAVRYYRYVQSIIEVVGDIESHHYIIGQLRHISEVAKVNTGVDINPLAQIGTCFIIDHGVNTVIGERCIIGNNFHVMQDVVLGADSRNKCDPKDRHPKIGNNVTIFGGAKILGNIHIGDDCVIGANCIVTNDVPANSNVSIVNQLQITKIKTNANPKIFGIIPKDESEIFIAGDSMDGLCAEIVKYDEGIIKEHDLVSCEIIDQDSKSIHLKVNILSDEYSRFSLRLFSKTNNVDIIIKECLAYNYIKKKEIKL